MPKETNERPEAVAKAIATFKAHDGVLRMADALRAGIHRNTLYAMLEQGVVERLCRGLYRLTDDHPLGNPDLVTVATKVPNGVLCLLSALAYHELTTQIPHEIHVAISRNSEPPRIDYPPIRVYRFSGSAFSEGIERPIIDNVPVAIYDREKTLADCFKYRNKIGMDSVLESLRLYKDQRRIHVDALLHYSSICRVTKVIRPYLESIL